MRQHKELSACGLRLAPFSVYPPASEDEKPMFTRYVTMNAPKGLDRLPVQGEGACVEDV